MSAGAEGHPAYQRLKLATIAPHVLHVELHRPDKLNAFDELFWEEMRLCFERVAYDAEVRVVLVSAAGRLFTAGLDLAAVASIGPSTGGSKDVARAALRIRRTGKAWQDSFTNMEKCGKAVIVCAHGGVIGAGLEMMSACDVRLCTRDAYFIMAEVDVGLAADVGGLQRFPKVVGNQSLVRELALSARRMEAEEALRMGFVSRLFDTKDAMLDAALELAEQIAGKSPVATLGVKEFLNYSRDHSVDESLDFAITWNMSMLQGTDMALAAAGKMQRSLPKFNSIPASTRSKL